MSKFFLILILSFSPLTANALSDKWKVVYGDEEIGMFYSPSTKHIDGLGRPSMWFKFTSDFSDNLNTSSNILYTFDCNLRKIGLSDHLFLDKNNMVTTRMEIPIEEVTMLTVTPDSASEYAYDLTCK